MAQTDRILVVDDSKSVRTAIQEILEADYIVETASSGEEAIGKVDEFGPDLILLDVMMDGMDGYAVCKHLKDGPGPEFIKILMVSSQADLKERLLGYEAGADDYIGKPFNEEELRSKVRVFLRLKRAEDQLQTLNEQLNEQVRLRTQQLIDSEKMAAIGRHAAGIVHNLNNPLQAIMGIAELMVGKHPDNRHVLNLRLAAAQMKKIIGSVLTAGSRETLTEETAIDLNEVIRAQLDLLRATPFFNQQVRIDLDLGPLPPVKGIHAHFSQTLSNILKNAVESMHGSEEKQLAVSTLKEDLRISIRISDTGHGIAREKIDRIFNPFYTTKPLTAGDGRPTGTGLGLAYCKEMIESYGGEIRVTSEVGKGSTFTLHLPFIQTL